MITQKKLAGLGFGTYGLATALVISVSYLVLIFFPRIEDWELFSYNFYGSIFIYGLALFFYLIFLSLIKPDRIKWYSIFLVLFIGMEVSALVQAGASITFSIFTTMVMDENYILLAYPIFLILSFVIFLKLLRIDSPPN